MKLASQLFEIRTEDYSSLLAGEESFRISRSSYPSVPDFEEGWGRRFTKDYSTEISYSAIVSVTKETAQNTVCINYTTGIGLLNSFIFAFCDENDCGRLFHCLEENLGMKRTDERLSPLKALSPYLVGIFITLAVTLLACFKAADIENGEQSEGTEKQKRFFYMLQTLGPEGVLVLGLLITAYLVYKISEGYSNAPVLMKFLPVMP